MGKKISQLQELLANDTVQANDLLVVFDASANSAKKMTVQEFLTLVDAGLDIGALTVLAGASLDIVSDYLVIRDASAGGENKKITPIDFFSRYSIQFLDDLAGGAVVQGQDYIGIYDGSANTYKKITVNDLLGLVSAGLDYFTEADNTTNVSLTPNSAATNVGIALVPKGTGAFQLRSSGNTRGTRAVDLQIWDSGSSDVAAGPYSCITHGQQNAIGTGGSYSRVGGSNAYIDQQRMDVWANGSNGNTSDGANQVMRTIMRNLSFSGATPFGLFTNPGTSKRPELPQGGTFWNVSVKVVVACALQGNGTVLADEAFAHNYKLLIKRSGTTTSIVGSVQEIGTAIADTNMSTVSVAITANDTFDSLAIEVTVPNGGTTGRFAATALVEITQLLV